MIALVSPTPVMSLISLRIWLTSLITIWVSASAPSTLPAAPVMEPAAWPIAVLAFDDAVPS